MLRRKATPPALIWSKRTCAEEDRPFMERHGDGREVQDFRQHILPAGGVKGRGCRGGAMFPRTIGGETVASSLSVGSHVVVARLRVEFHFHGMRVILRRFSKQSLNYGNWYTPNAIVSVEVRNKEDVAPVP